jgi:hypothetical protein
VTPAELAQALRNAKQFVGALDHCTDQAGAAAFLCVSERTLETWREAGEGPACSRSARWLYPLDELIAFWDSRKNRPQEPADSRNAPQFGRGAA